MRTEFVAYQHTPQHCVAHKWLLVTLDYLKYCRDSPGIRGTSSCTTRTVWETRLLEKCSHFASVTFVTLNLCQVPLCTGYFVSYSVPCNHGHESINQKESEFEGKSLCPDYRRLQEWMNECSFLCIDIYMTHPSWNYSNTLSNIKPKILNISACQHTLI